MAILTVSILPVQQHGISFHLFVLSSVSFTNVLQYSEYRPFVSLIKYIPSVSGKCWCNFKWDSFVLSLPDSSFLVYRNSIDFCVLYPATLLKSFISCKFLGRVFRVLYGVSCHLQIVTFFISSFPVWTFYFFSFFN